MSAPAARPVAFLFDQDGVLIDSAAIVRAGWQRFTGRRGQVLDEAHLARIHGRRTVDILVEDFGLSLEEAEREAAAWREAGRPGELARDVDLPEVPGAVDFVRTAAGAMPVALVSSAARLDVRFVLRQLGLDAVFRVVVAAEDVGAGKPAPDPYLAAAAALGVSCDRCVVFEDTPAGIAAGRAAGARVVGLATTLAREALVGADLVIDDFASLTPAEVIARLTTIGAGGRP